ncbi:MAG: hypothetical protein AAF438_01480 [Pseudomonadota bacterium]
MNHKVVAAIGILAALIFGATVILTDGKNRQSEMVADTSSPQTEQTTQPREFEDENLSSSIAENVELDQQRSEVVWLVGTIVSAQPDSAMASVADADNPGGANYRIGDELPDGSLLEAVYENEAQVSLLGETRILYISGFDGGPNESKPGKAGLSDSGWKGDYEDAKYNDQTEDD